MEDIYVKILVEEQDKLGIPPKKLCHGICTEEMLCQVRSGEKFMDRVTVKRLLARLGVDNADYSHYLEAPDYNTWLKRMKIINAVEDGKIAEAESLLSDYDLPESSARNKSRVNIEKQFYTFMKLQIMRNSNEDAYEKCAGEMYGEAVKLTVPDIDIKNINEVLLSPLEYNLVLEYRRRSFTEKSLQDTICMYRELLKYLDEAPYGKMAKIKVYPKTVVYIYRDVKKILEAATMDEVHEIYEELLLYCEKALKQLQERKCMYYLTEILDMKVELLSWFKDNSKSSSEIKKYEESLENVLPPINTLKDLYKEYDINPYMDNDCYLYRESGMYCIGEVIRKRRKMMGISREELCEGICSVKTLMRVENEKGTMVKGIFKELFERLGLLPEYMDMRIVTDKKEAVELYEDIRFASNSFKYDEVARLIPKLRGILPDHPINTRMLLRQESINRWRLGEITTEKFIENIRKALETTVKMEDISKAGKSISLSDEEQVMVYLISIAYEKIGKLDEANTYIKAIWEYCTDMEKRGLADGRMGIYETVMTYVASLLGDMGKYDESNDISYKLIETSLKIKRNAMIHHKIYNMAWNNNERKIQGFDYNKELYRCIYISQLTDDVNDEIFYKKKLS